MKSSCEMRKKFLVSKLLYKNFLNMKQMQSKLGKDFIDSVHSFITNHIEPHESHFSFYFRYNLKHTNSIHEGKNCALKYNSAHVGPRTNLEESLTIMCNNAERNVKKKGIVASLDFRGTKIHSKLTCVNKVVPMAEAIMLDNWCRKDSYKSLKTSSSIWLVTYDFDS